MLTVFIAAAPVVPAINAHHEVEYIDAHIGKKPGGKTQIDINQHVYNSCRVSPDVFVAGKKYAEYSEYNGYEFDPGCSQQSLVE